MHPGGMLRVCQPENGIFVDPLLLHRDSLAQTRILNHHIVCRSRQRLCMRWACWTTAS